MNPDWDYVRNRRNFLILGAAGAMGAVITPAQAQAGLAPPYYVNVKDYGAVGNGTVNDTGSIQAALDSFLGMAGIVIVPSGKYKITSAIRLRSGQTLEGIGWSTDPNTTNVKSGSSFEYYGSGRAIECYSLNDDAPEERVSIKNLAIINKLNGTDGIYFSNTRYMEVDNVYIFNFISGLNLWHKTWLCRFVRIMVFNSLNGFFLSSGGEDSIFENCLVRYCDTACNINYHSQTNIFIGCDFGYSRTCVRMGNDLNLPMHATFQNCYFEYDLSVSSPVSIFLLESAAAEIAQYPSVKIDGCRFHVLQGTENLIPVIYAKKANKIELSNSRAGKKLGYVIYTADNREIGDCVFINNEDIATYFESTASSLSRIIHKTIISNKPYYSADKRAFVANAASQSVFVLPDISGAVFLLTVVDSGGGASISRTYTVVPKGYFANAEIIPVNQGASGSLIVASSNGNTIKLQTTASLTLSSTLIRLV